MRKILNATRREGSSNRHPSVTHDDLSKVSDFCMCADLSQQRAQTIEALGLEPGGTFLDIGCGLGHLCRDAELAMGNKGSVVGIDKNRENVAFAASFGSSSCRYIQADALALPIKPHSIDRAACVQVAEYVRDTSTLLSNVQRVLRKGGKALFVTTDWANMSWSAADPAPAETIKALWSKHCAHPRVHASLANDLNRAGLVVEKSWVHTIRNTRFDETQYSFGLLEMIGSFASVTRNSYGRSVVDGWRAHLRALHDQGKYAFSLDRVFHLVAQP